MKNVEKLPVQMRKLSSVRPLTQLDLKNFDGQLVDGLDSCRRVYDFFDQVRGQADGVAKLRIRPTKSEKRLIEELIPIARYVQARYREGRRIKVRWLSGSQPYDAILWSSGALVAHHMAPKKALVEVTTAVHQNDYLRRELLNESGGSFSVKGILRDKRTGTIVSKPHVYRNDEHVRDLVSQILERLQSKGRKAYPQGMVLIVNCVTDSLILGSEWNEAVEQVTKANLHLRFREVFLIETVMSHCATLYGNPKR